MSKERRKGAISLRRALDLACVSKGERNSLKAKSRFSSRVAESLVSSAVDALRGAGDAHFALEKIYGKTMDFLALNEYTENFIDELLVFLKKYCR